jgi:hypothetical protein
LPMLSSSLYAGNSIVTSGAGGKVEPVVGINDCTLNGVADIFIDDLGFILTQKKKKIIFFYMLSTLLILF